MVRKAVQCLFGHNIVLKELGLIDRNEQSASLTDRLLLEGFVVDAIYRPCLKAVESKVNMLTVFRLLSPLVRQA